MPATPSPVLAAALAFALLLSACGKKSGADAGKPPSNCRCCDPARILTANLQHLPPAELRAGYGNAHMAITTSKPEAQAFFDQGLNLLHDFWELEAYRAFARATALDPDCGMAYWGLVMCLPGSRPEWVEERARALAKAVELKPRLTPIEQAYIAATQELVSKGSLVFAEHMERLWQQHPEELNAGAFAAYYLRDGYNAAGRPSTQHARALAIAAAVLKGNPEHTPTLHYAIHLLETGPDLDSAATLAKRGAQLAPASGHLVHMPGHVEYFSGDYEAARQTYLKADAIERAYLDREHVPAYEHENYLHNLHFLAITCIELGRLKDALACADIMKAVPLEPSRDISEGTAQVNFDGRTLAGRAWLRLGNYPRAIAALTRDLDGASGPCRLYLHGLRHYATAMQALDASDLTAARQAHQSLIETAAEAERVSKSPQPANQPFYIERTFSTLFIIERVLRGQLASSEGSGRVFIDSAIEADGDSYRRDPPLLPMTVHELAADFYFRRGNPEAARASLDKANAQRPHSAIIGRLIAKAETALGHPAEAAAASAEAERLWAGADAELK